MQALLRQNQKSYTKAGKRMNATEQYIYLSACAASGKTAELEKADFETLWNMSRSHNMTALTAKGLLATEGVQKCR